MHERTGASRGSGLKNSEFCDAPELRAIDDHVCPFDRPQAGQIAFFDVVRSIVVVCNVGALMHGRRRHHASSAGFRLAVLGSVFLCALASRFVSDKELEMKDAKRPCAPSGRVDGEEHLTLYEALYLSWHMASGLAWLL